MATMILSRRGMIWMVCAALAALADWLFYQQPIGWTLAIFTAATAAMVALRSPVLWKTWPGRIALALMAIILLALVEEPSPPALLMVMVMLGTLVMMGGGGKGWKSEIGVWAKHWGHLLLTLWTRVFLDNRIVRQWFRRHPSAKPRLIRVLVRWVIPLAGGLIFILLFAVANPIIENWLTSFWNRIWTVLDWLPRWLGPGRLTLWILVAIGAYGLLRYRQGRMAVTVRIPPVVRPPSLFGHEPIVRCLIVFNAVFALESILDIIYLFGGATLPAGMTYKTYAHRGAYPLVATALLTALFVLLTFRTGGAAQRSAAARRLVYLWIIQNLFLMITTIWRLWLYVDVDGLTRLRISTMIWLGLVGLGFIFVIMKIVQGRSNAWLWRMNIITTFITLYACAFINFDGFIARQNVTHCLETTGQGQSIDLAYLRHLGPESLPALAWLREQDAKDGEKIDALMKDLRGELAADLSDWRGWTYRRWREAPAELRTEARRLRPLVMPISGEVVADKTVTAPQ